jgi:hydrogenase maturation protein HypF
MENYETLQAFEQGIAHYEQLFRVSPSALAYDLHPNYLATRYAQTRAENEAIPAYGIQHHHAHIAACMADNDLSGYERVIGISFDGTGYGTDGAIWGGEFLIADYRSFERAAHLAYTPLPGGDASVRKPARTALAYLWHYGLSWDNALAPVQAICAEERTALTAQLEHKINSPQTSSMGRLFDAVASLAGVRQQVNYEAQAAIEFEALADPQETGLYSFEIHSSEASDANANPVSDEPLLISAAPLLEAILADVYASVRIPIISARFHNGVAQMVLDVCRNLRKAHAIRQVVLSGGVWQNVTLLTKVRLLLILDGFHPYIHKQVPPNDGGVSLGQAAIAAHSMQG